MKYEVTLEGTFVTDIMVEAKSEKEAEKKALSELNKKVLLSEDDFFVDTITPIPEVLL